MLKGIYPVLKHIVDKSCSAAKKAKKQVKNVGRGELHGVEAIAFTDRNDVSNTMEPDDFMWCHVCEAEISNFYFRCIGCSKNPRGKDFCICLKCHSDKEYAHNWDLETKKKLHEQETMKAPAVPLTSTNCHLGAKPEHCDFQKGSKRTTGKHVDVCSMVGKKDCSRCNHCEGCSCRCHTWFELRQRDYSEAKLQDLLKDVEKKLERPDNDAKEDDMIQRRLNLPTSDKTVSVANEARNFRSALRELKELRRKEHESSGNDDQEPRGKTTKRPSNDAATPRRSKRRK